MNCTASLTSKLGIQSTIENSTYIPLIGVISSLAITGIALKTMYRERSDLTTEKTLTNRQQGELAFYNIVNVATLGTLGACFGIVKLAIWLTKATCSCLAKKEDSQSPIENSTCLTPKKTIDIDITEEVKALTPVKVDEKSLEMEKIKACLQLITKINCYNITLEEKQNKILSTIEKEDSAKIKDLKSRLPTITEESEVIKILQEPAFPYIEIRPLTESFRAARIVLNKFPQLQSYFSKETQADWESSSKKDIPISKNEDLYLDEVNMALLLRLRRELDEITEEKEVLRYLNWCMLEEYEPYTLGELEDVSTIVLSQFPSLQAFFDDLEES